MYDPTFHYDGLVKGKITDKGEIRLIKLNKQNQETEVLEFGRYSYKIIGPKPLYNHLFFTAQSFPNKDLFKMVRNELEQNNLKEILFVAQGIGISNNYLIIGQKS